VTTVLPAVDPLDALPLAIIITFLSYARHGQPSRHDG
jgi:hypothetical protein